MITLLNCSIITTDGVYEARTISLEKAKEIIGDAENVESAIGHESTAQIMTELLGMPVKVNRIRYSQSAGEKAIIFQLNGRPPEGKVLSRKKIEEIGYSWRLLSRSF